MRRLCSSLALLPWSAIVVGLAGVGCVGVTGNPAPDDAPAFPTGLAVDPTGDRLVVVSSNFDLAYDGGAILLADLARTRAALADADADGIVDDAWSSAIALPSFGDSPVVDVTGRHVLLTTRGGNLLHELELDDDGLSCGDAGCAAAPHALQLADNDPFGVLMLQQAVDPAGTLTAARALVTHLSAGSSALVRFDPAKNDESRLRLERSRIAWGDDVFGVRSAAMLAATSTTPERVVALLERRLDGVLLGSDLAIVDVPGVDRGSEATVIRTDITALTGALTGRDLVVVADPTRGAAEVAVVVVLRSPDAIARFAVDDVTGSVTLTHLDGTCRKPTSLAAVAVDADADTSTPGVPRVLLTCQEGQTVESLDPLDLSVTDAVRFDGRGPYDVVVDEGHQQAFVSFFLDGSIGVLSLVDDGVARLRPIGRIGHPRPAPEDGRE